jgi:hypothetical protein
MILPLSGAARTVDRFAPLTLANQAGIFKKNGLDVTIKKIPQKDRHLPVLMP